MIFWPIRYMTLYWCWDVFFFPWIIMARESDCMIGQWEDLRSRIYRSGGKWQPIMYVQKRVELAHNFSWLSLLILTQMKRSWPIIFDLAFFFVMILGVIWSLQASTETIRWEKYTHGVVLICHRSNTIMIIPLDLPALLKLSISFHHFQLRSSISRHCYYGEKVCLNLLS